MKYDKHAIKRIRTQKGLHTDEIARRAKLASRTVYYLDRGMTSPKADTLARIATALDVPIEAFFAA